MIRENKKKEGQKRKNGGKLVKESRKNRVWQKVEGA